jgi:BASS family bile acid:Na+ symporter
MDLKHLVLLALQISIIATVLSFGLNTTLADLTYLLRRPWLLARALLAVFVIMPLVAVALVRWFDFPPMVEVVLIALAVSPVPPLLPQREGKAGGEVSFGVALMAALAVASIVAVPTTVAILERVFGRQFVMPTSTIVALVLKTTLVPLAAGVILRIALPALAARIGRIVTVLARLLLPAAALALLAGLASAVWAAIGAGTVLALVLFVAAGLAIGHLLGGDNANHSVVLALSTACRHPAIAMTIATANYPEQQFGGTIVLYLLLNLIVAVPYIRWHKARPPSVVAAR